MHSNNTSGCNAAMVFYVFCDIFCTFLITAIAFNLQLIFVHNYRKNVNLELWYLVTSFVLSVILAIIPAIPQTTGYAYHDQYSLCWYAASQHSMAAGGTLPLDHCLYTLLRGSFGVSSLDDVPSADHHQASLQNLSQEI